jgi:Ca2+-binding EF-hand superfamily protein
LVLYKQPPKRRGAPASSSAAPKRARQSKLAKENNISAEEENEIKEVFQLFADSHEDFPKEKEGVIPREDVRKALVYVQSNPVKSRSSPPSDNIPQASAQAHLGHTFNSPR